MSITALNWAFSAKVKPSNAKFILVALSNYADEAGYCYPSQARLARDTGQSERSVRRHLASSKPTNGLRGASGGARTGRGPATPSISTGPRASGQSVRLSPRQAANLTGATGQIGRNNRPIWPPLNH